MTTCGSGHWAGLGTTYTDTNARLALPAACAPGTEWIAASATCVACEAGKASAGGVEAVCVACPTGWLLNADASACYGRSVGLGRPE